MQGSKLYTVLLILTVIVQAQWPAGDIPAQTPAERRKAAATVAVTPLHADAGDEHALQFAFFDFQGMGGHFFILSRLALVADELVQLLRICCRFEPLDSAKC